MESIGQKAHAQLIGNVAKVVFASPQTDFKVLIVTRADDAAEVVATGFFTGVKAGVTITIYGQWEEHARYGRQLKAQEFSVELPVDPAGLEKYLASGVFKGVGPSMATKIVNAFGSRSLHVLQHEPERLLQLPGLGKAKLEGLLAGWQEQKVIAALMVYLRSMGLSAGLAGKVYRLYGNNAVELLKANPYRLAQDLTGVGFKTADRIALTSGMPEMHPLRYQAAILWMLQKSWEEGHLYIERAKLLEAAQELLGISVDQEDGHAKFLQSLEHLVKSERLVSLNHEQQIWIGLQSSWKLEQRIAEKIKLLCHSKGVAVPTPGELFASLQAQALKLGRKLSERQEEAILLALTHKLVIITGGPGTGKTTTLQVLVTMLKALRVEFKLASPTGRAAKRMSESAGCFAQTLHRLLEFNPDENRWERNAERTLQADWVIIDEVSMVDAPLFDALLQALSPKTHLILIGDADQLASVGPGNILGDLLASGKANVVRLDQIFRQAEGSMIVENAHRVNQGEFIKAPKLASVNESGRADFYFHSMEDPQAFPALLTGLYSKLQAKFGIDPRQAILLSPMIKGFAGLQNLNGVLQEFFQPSYKGPVLTNLGRSFRLQDAVMQVRNNYDKEVFNGDLGRVESIDVASAELKVNFGGKLCTYQSYELVELNLAYAISIHKSQGSEFPVVIIPFFCEHFLMLQRKILYTGITRAKRLCILVGQVKAVMIGIKNNKSVQRRTKLVELLQEQK